MGGKQFLHSDWMPLISRVSFPHAHDEPRLQRSHVAAPLMATLEEFKALRDGVPAEMQAELYRLFTADPEASFRRMVEIAAEKGMTLTVEEVKGFLKQMDEDDEFDDFELDAVALAAIAGGRGGSGGC